MSPATPDTSCASFTQDCPADLSAPKTVSEPFRLLCSLLVQEQKNNGSLGASLHINEGDQSQSISPQTQRDIKWAFISAFSSIGYRFAENTGDIMPRIRAKHLSGDPAGTTITFEKLTEDQQWRVSVLCETMAELTEQAVMAECRRRGVESAWARDTLNIGAPGGVGPVLTITGIPPSKALLQPVLPVLL